MRYSEHYIYASNDGPSILEQGDAYIEINAIINIQAISPNIPTISLAAYASDEDHKDYSLTGTHTYTHTYTDNNTNTSVNIRYIKLSFNLVYIILLL